MLAGGHHASSGSLESRGRGSCGSGGGGSASRELVKGAQQLRCNIAKADQSQRAFLTIWKIHIA